MYCSRTGLTVLIKLYIHACIEKMGIQEHKSQQGHFDIVKLNLLYQTNYRDKYTKYMFILLNKLIVITFFLYNNKMLFCSKECDIICKLEKFIFQCQYE